MLFEMTVQIRVPSMKEGLHYYETLLNREPDFIPHDGFAEWELLPGCWLQVAEGTPSEGSGPIRLAVKDIEAERKRLMEALHIEKFQIESREEVPVKWATFSDPWGNQLGFFEYLNKEEEKQQKKSN